MEEATDAVLAAPLDWPPTTSADDFVKNARQLEEHFGKIAFYNKTHKAIHASIVDILSSGGTYDASVGASSDRLLGEIMKAATIGEDLAKTIRKVSVRGRQLPEKE